MMRRRGPGLIGMAARTAVVAGTATAVSGRVRERQYEKAEAKAEQAAPPPDAPAPPPAAPAAPAGDDTVAKLKELAELHSAGALSDDEFAAAKAKLLG